MQNTHVLAELPHHPDSLLVGPWFPIAAEVQTAWSDALKNPDLSDKLGSFGTFVQLRFFTSTGQSYRVSIPDRVAAESVQRAASQLVATSAQQDRPVNVGELYGPVLRAWLIRGVPLAARASAVAQNAQCTATVASKIRSPK